MTQSRPSDASPQSDKPTTRTVEELCQRFQLACQNGKRIRIEDILDRAQLADENRLLRGLLIVEVGFLRREGKNPSPAVYRARFPAQTSVVEEVFNILGDSLTPALSHPEQSARSRKKSFDVEDIPVEVVKEGNRHRRPASSSQKPQNKKDPFDLEIVEVPAKPVAKPPAGSRSKPAAGRKASKDSLDDILSQMQPLNSRVRAVRDHDDEEDKEDRPRVKKIKKKKKKQKASSDSGDGPMEFAVPLGLLLISALVNVVFAVVFVPAGVPVWMYLLVKVGYILFTTAVTTAALFAAAAILDTQYGYLNTGLVKIGAICLTQTWIGELSLHLPGAALIEIGAWVATYVMFLMFFQLGAMEALASMSVVRIAHRLAYAFLFLSLLSFYANGGRTGLEEAAAEAVENHIAAKGDMGGAGEKAPPEYDQLTKKFGDALMQEKYSDAYALMSEAYRKKNSLENFSEIHKDARRQYGKALKMETGVGTIDKEELKEEDYGELSKIPAHVRRAWMNAQLALEINDGEVDRCYDCWMLLIDEGGKLVVGRFEYSWCD